MDFNFLTAANFRLVNFVLKLAELLSCIIFLPGDVDSQEFFIRVFSP